MRNYSYFNKNSSNVKCHTGNCGNVNSRFFTVNYAMICSFSLSNTLNLTVFYCKIISQLFTVYKVPLKSRLFFTVEYPKILFFQCTTLHSLWLEVHMTKDNIQNAQYTQYTRVTLIRITSSFLNGQLISKLRRLRREEKRGCLV